MHWTGRRRIREGKQQITHTYAQPEHWYTLRQPRLVYGRPAAGHDLMQAGLLGSSEDALMLPRMRRCTASEPIIIDVVVDEEASMLPPAMAILMQSSASRTTQTLLSMVACVGLHNGCSTCWCLYVIGCYICRDYSSRAHLIYIGRLFAC